MPLSEETTKRVERVLAYHAATKHTYDSVRAAGPPLDWALQPQRYRTFQDCPTVSLGASILDVPAGTLALLDDGLEAVAESLLEPPQDLKTLSTWLFLGYGRTHKQAGERGIYWLRSCPSFGDLYPCEIYVAAFGIEGLEPGLYHYNPRDMTLSRLRDGHETLALLKRGRPDLELLKQAPAALLVSSIFCRSAWRYQERGYRSSLADAGHLTQNLATVATGLGMRTLVRLRVSDNAMHELIGLAPDASFADAEAVLSMVIWADKANHPLKTEGAPSSDAMPLIPRQPLAEGIAPCPSILATHADAVGGLGIHQARPPLTELDPLPQDFPMTHMPADERPDLGKPLREVLVKWRQAVDFHDRTISRLEFSRLNRLAFRTGTYFPILPGGPHTGLIRPFWIVNGVIGLESGVWCYDAPTDTWSALKLGIFRKEAAYLSMEQAMAGKAAAVCFMMANLNLLMNHIGPDVYTTAHLEAGTAAQRLHLAAAGMGLGSRGIAGFYDDEVKAFLGLERSTWEPVYDMAVGVPSALAGAAGGTVILTGPQRRG